MSDGFDNIRGEFERVGRVVPRDHEPAQPFDRPRRVRPMRVFWIVAAVVVAAFVLILILDPGSDSEPQGRSQA